MNILVLYKDNGKGGLTTNTKVLVEGLRKRQINTVVAGSDGLGTRTILSDLNVNIINFSSKNPIKVYMQIKKLVNDNKIDLIHAQNRIPSLYASVICMFNKKVKYVWANHQVPIPYDFFHRITTKYGERAITGSIDGYKLLTEKLRIPKEKVSIVNLGVDTSKFVPVSINEQNALKQKYQIKDNEKVILLYGRLTEHKGHFFLLESLAKLNSIENIKLILPGEGNEEYKNSIIEYAKKIGFEDKIIFPGFVNGREILSIADLMVLPSKQEGFPISCIEAYCMGIPVIRTKSGGYEDTKEFCTGVEYENTDELSTELQLFIEGDNKFSLKVKKALDCKERFSTSRMIDQYISIYNDIL